MKTTIQLLFILSILISACKSSKNVADESTVKKDQKLEQKATEAIEPDTQEAATEEQIPEAETKIHINRAKSKLSDSLVARIQRTACFGRCPIYTASIYKSGLVLYQGEKWVEKDGMFKSSISEEQLMSLIDKAKNIGFFKMDEAYDSPYVTDLPSTIVTLRNEGMVKVVANRYQGPEKLREFEMYFDEILNTLKYQPYSED